MENKKKANNLLKLSIICLLIQLLFFIIPGEQSGLLIYIIWIPPVFYVLYLFFKIIELIINKVL